ncbi:putative lactoperoxidase [Apostichopus japonicus]|uniref:Putative lactoperoxidase n=1 Tax=Stichopus japonicus TaxID=307972 RepID=A0A2G8LJW3_STIJA|nr:putative lactoperoxidase [Apostichopus japonicus]
MFLYAAILFDSSRVEDIDPFIGMVTEEPIRGAAVGPTAGCIIAHQFYALKYGDRFWYENTEGLQAFTDRQLREIRLSSYARLLCDNLANTETVQPYAFMMPQSSPRPRYDSFVEFSRSEKYPMEDGRLPGLSNQRVSCSDYQAIPRLNLNEWRDMIYT